MKKYIFILLATAGLTALGGCKEERPGFWEGGSRIRFYTPAEQPPANDYTVMAPTDGTPTVSSTITDTTVYYRLQVMGEAAPVDRMAKIEQFEVEGDTSIRAVEGVNFEWDTDVVVPAGALTVDFPIMLKYDPTKPNTSPGFYFRLVETADFMLTTSHYKARLTIGNR